ncbi:MAG TPA: hypothetical protein VF753_01410 [Terriglobales bacterium]
MLHHERTFEITSVSPPSAFCTRCRRKFIARPTPGESVDDMILRIHAEFDQHRCDQPPSAK